jgi:hypothetical protein
MIDRVWAALVAEIPGCGRSSLSIVQYSGFRLIGTHPDLSTLIELSGCPKYTKLHIKGKNIFVLQDSPQLTDDPINRNPLYIRVFTQSLYRRNNTEV